MKTITQTQYAKLSKKINEAKKYLDKIEEITKECSEITKDDDYTFDAVWNGMELNSLLKKLDIEVT